MATSEELTVAGLRIIENTSCLASAIDLGATVTSWQPSGQADVLFLSRDARVSEGDEVHGGIPICAPWFGWGRDDVPVPRPHGLVRWVPWRLVSEVEQDDSTTLVWELCGDDVAHLPGAGDYPSDVTFRHEVRFGSTLNLSLTISSPTTSFVLDQAFHTYFSVSDVMDVVIDGLGGSRYRDYMDDATWHDATSETLHVREHTDRIYDGAQQITITDADRVLTLTATGASNTVVWNPGPDGAQSLRGWAGDEWTGMVCVEIGNVQHNAVTVPAGGSHTMSMQVAVRPVTTPE